MRAFDRIVGELPLERRIKLLTRADDRIKYDRTDRNALLSGDETSVKILCRYYDSI
jgi:hypothetical protein